MEYTELKGRKLYYDGDSVVTKEYLYNKLLNNEPISHLFVDEIDQEIKNYNNHNELKLKTKESLNNLQIDWNIPDKYKNLSLKPYLFKSLEAEIEINPLSSTDIEKRIERIETEYNLWNSHKLLFLLKTLIYVVDTFKEKNIIWGTGRGSSCCCYILYLIGIHDVDSVRYNLDITEFFRE